MTTLIILDTETVGLKPPAPPATGVVEFAYLHVNLETLQVQDEFVSLINPGCPIEPEAAAIHGITDEMVAGKRSLSADMLPYEDVLACGHNHPFDKRFLASTFPAMQRSICTLTLARRHIKGPANHKLTTLADFLKLPAQKAHSALGDCYYALGLLQEIVKITGKSVLQLEERSNTAVVWHRMPFGKYKDLPLHQVPVDYLRWFSQQDIDGDLKKTIEIHLKAR